MTTEIAELMQERLLLTTQLQKFLDKYPQVCIEQLRNIPRVSELERMIARIEQRMLSEESAAIAAFRP